MPHLATFSQALAKLLPQTGHEEFPAAMVGLMRELIPIDDATILVYPDTDLPVVVYSENPVHGASSTLDRFVKGAFLLDPYYLKASREKEFGVFRLRDLSPKGFRDSEYFRTWYRYCGYQDECGYLIATKGEGFVNISLGRGDRSRPFTKAQLRILESVYPVIEALCRQHWSGESGSGKETNLRARMQAALNSFGSSLLTEREVQAINMILHGHSTRTIAERLSISIETVKLHRKHAYAKLEISSQAELFYLFLDSLMSASDYHGGDTLVAYMKPPGRD